MVAVVTQSTFSYSALSPENQKAARRCAISIRRGLRDQLRGVMRVGQELIAAKEAVGHKKFGSWLLKEFGWSERTAQNYMAVYREFKNATVADSITLKALYMLASGKVPTGAKLEALELAAGGQKVDDNNAKDLIAKHKMLALPATTSDPKPPTAAPLRFQPGMVAHCKHCDQQFDGRELAKYDYAFDEWIPVEPNLWRCPQKHRTSDPLMKIAVNSTPHYDPAERAWCLDCADWQHFIDVGGKLWQCKVCGHRVHDDTIDAWTPEAAAEVNSVRPSAPKPASPPAARSVATHSPSAFIPGSGTLSAVSAPSEPPAPPPANENWRTPDHILALVVAVLGVADMEIAEDQSVSDRPLQGRVFLNAPGGGPLGLWVPRLLDGYWDHRTPQAIALLPARLEMDWFQKMAIRSSSFCLIQEWLTLTTPAGETRKTPYPSVAFYLGTPAGAVQFSRHFGDLGAICKSART